MPPSPDSGTTPQQFCQTFIELLRLDRDSGGGTLDTKSVEPDIFFAIFPTATKLTRGGIMSEIFAYLKDNWLAEFIDDKGKEIRLTEAARGWYDRFDSDPTAQDEFLHLLMGGSVLDDSFDESPAPVEEVVPQDAMPEKFALEGSARTLNEPIAQAADEQVDENPVAELSTTYRTEEAQPDSMDDASLYETVIESPEDAQTDEPTAQTEPTDQTDSQPSDYGYTPYQPLPSIRVEIVDEPVNETDQLVIVEDEPDSSIHDTRPSRSTAVYTLGDPYDARDSGDMLPENPDGLTIPRIPLTEAASQYIADNFGAPRDSLTENSFTDTDNASANDDANTADVGQETPYVETYVEDAEPPARTGGFGGFGAPRTEHADSVNAADGADSLDSQEDADQATRPSRPAGGFGGFGSPRSEAADSAPSGFGSRRNSSDDGGEVPQKPQSSFGGFGNTPRDDKSSTTRPVSSAGIGSNFGSGRGLEEEQPPDTSDPFSKTRFRRPQNQTSSDKGDKDDSKSMRRPAPTPSDPPQEPSRSGGFGPRGSGTNEQIRQATPPVGKRPADPVRDPIRGTGERPPVDRGTPSRPDDSSQAAGPRAGWRTRPQGSDAPRTNAPSTPQSGSQSGKPAAFKGGASDRNARPAQPQQPQPLSDPFARFRRPNQPSTGTTGTPSSGIGGRRGQQNMAPTGPRAAKPQPKSGNDDSGGAAEATDHVLIPLQNGQYIRLPKEIFAVEVEAQGGSVARAIEAIIASVISSQSDAQADDQPDGQMDDQTEPYYGEE